MDYSIDRGISIIITVVLIISALYVLADLGNQSSSFLFKLEHINASTCRNYTDQSVGGVSCRFGAETTNTIVTTMAGTVLPILFFVGVGVAIIYSLYKKFS